MKLASAHLMFVSAAIAAASTILSLATGHYPTGLWSLSACINALIAGRAMLENAK